MYSAVLDYYCTAVPTLGPMPASDIGFRSSSGRSANSRLWTTRYYWGAEAHYTSYFYKYYYYYYYCCNTEGKNTCEKCEPRTWYDIASVSKHLEKNPTKLPRKPGRLAQGKNAFQLLGLPEKENDR